jgi:hypothetical protein
MTKGTRRKAHIHSQRALAADQSLKKDRRMKEGPMSVSAPEIEHLTRIVDRVSRGESISQEEAGEAVRAVSGRCFFDVTSGLKQICLDFGLTGAEIGAIHARLRDGRNPGDNIDSEYRSLCSEAVRTRFTQGRFVDGILRFGDGASLRELEGTIDIDTGEVVTEIPDVINCVVMKPSYFVNEDFYVEVGLIMIDDEPKVYVVDRKGMESLPDSYSKSKHKRFMVGFQDEDLERVIYLSRRHFIPNRPSLLERIQLAFEDVTGKSSSAILRIVGCD